MSTESDLIRAFQSSHLEWKPTPSDIDMVVAAGKVRESLATRLIRLRGNFDALSAVNEGPVMLALIKGFPETLAILQLHAREMSEAANYTPTDRELDQLAYKVLGLFLEPKCQTCSGTGRIGAFGGPRPTCTVCNGSTNRSLKWTADQDEFVRDLQASMDAKIQNALFIINRWRKTLLELRAKGLLPL